MLVVPTSMPMSRGSEDVFVFMVGSLLDDRVGCDYIILKYFSSQRQIGDWLGGRLGLTTDNLKKER